MYRIFFYVVVLFTTTFISATATAQKLVVTEFRFISEGCPDYISDHPEFKKQVIEALEAGLKKELKLEKITYLEADPFKHEERNAGIFASPTIKNKVKVLTNSDATYFASMICYFKLGVAMYGEVDIVNFDFTTRIEVLNKKGKKQFRKKSAIPVRPDPYCPIISDTWINSGQFHWLVTEGLNEAFSSRKKDYDRIILECGRSFPLQERLSRLDSFQIHRYKQEINAVARDSTFYRLYLKVGSAEPETAEWLFGWDLSSKLTQKGDLVDLTNQKTYELVISVADDENYIDTLGFGDQYDPAITYYLNKQLITQFTMVNHDHLLGVWEGDTLSVREDHNEQLNYFINDQWVALSEDFPRDKSRNEQFSRTLFHHNPYLEPKQLQMLVHGIIGFQLGYAMWVMAEEDD